MGVLTHLDVTRLDVNEVRKEPLNNIARCLPRDELEEGDDGTVALVLYPTMERADTLVRLS